MHSNVETCYNSTVTEQKKNLFVLCILGSLVRPKVVRSVHYCPATKKTLERKYTDMTSLDAFPSSAIYPTKVFLVCVHLLHM